MENIKTVVVTENRDTTNKLKKWYKEKIIDTNSIEKFTEQKENFDKMTLDVGGKVFNVVAIKYPAFKIAAAIINSPFAKKIEDMRRTLEGKLITSAYNAIGEKYYSDEGFKKVAVPKFDFEKNTNGLVESGMDLYNQVGALQGGKNK